MKIEKGNHYMCIENWTVIYGGETEIVRYKKGHLYQSKENGYLTDEQGNTHNYNFNEAKTAGRYFRPATQEEISQLQTASKEMSNTNDRITLRQQIREKLHELLPKIGDELFVNEGFDVSFDGMNHGFGAKRGQAEKIYHSNLKDRFGDRFICGTTNGGIEIGEMTTGDLQQLNNILDEKKYSFSKEAAPDKALKPDSRFSEEIQGAKAKLFATILEAKKDMGDEISIAPTEISEKGDKYVITEILPDFESPFEDQNIIGGVSHSGDEGCVHNLALCLENVNDAEVLEKAVHEAHVKHIEQDAKQTIRDRIVTPSAHSFTANQVEILNRYHQVATPDTPANEAFSRLLDEVAKEPDVARKPEKWVTDTAKELDDLAEGIAREQGRGLHM